jgi:hypothetical protein
MCACHFTSMPVYWHAIILANESLPVYSDAHLHLELPAKTPTTMLIPRASPRQIRIRRRLRPPRPNPLHNSAGHPRPAHMVNPTAERVVQVSAESSPRYHFPLLPVGCSAAIPAGTRPILADSQL